MRLKPNGDGTVTDTKTGLTWQADPFVPLAEIDRLRFLLMTGNPKALDSHMFTWQEATDYASCLSLGGHADWRLPMKEELLELCEYCKQSHGSKKLLFLNNHANYYWSSTTHANYTYYAWCVYFIDGLVYYYNKSYYYYVRCVRGGQ